VSCGSSGGIFLYRRKKQQRQVFVSGGIVKSLLVAASALERDRGSKARVPVRICRNASSTPVASSAEVSMKARLFVSAKAIAVSVLTALLCFKSL